ncbi:hypothetical protein PsYK624_168400 [Phanerochaete sordida]|uniref:Uncharacterized protein n=1 Tax=Phanerochaete sordida TaxID=48140 RepID=A0A9P3GT69_9APHY|nr:hypothetical protein PsYK624_168400 [Phanerochaete sordida]
MQWITEEDEVRWAWNDYDWGIDRMRKATLAELEGLAVKFESLETGQPDGNRTLWPAEVEAANQPDEEGMEVDSESQTKGPDDEDTAMVLSISVPEWGDRSATAPRRLSPQKLSRRTIDIPTAHHQNTIDDDAHAAVAGPTGLTGIQTRVERPPESGRAIHGPGQGDAKAGRVRTKDEIATCAARRPATKTPEKESCKKAVVKDEPERGLSSNPLAHLVSTLSTLALPLIKIIHLKNMASLKRGPLLKGGWVPPPPGDQQIRLEVHFPNNIDLRIPEITSQKILNLFIDVPPSHGPEAALANLRAHEVRTLDAATTPGHDVATPQFFQLRSASFILWSPDFASPYRAYEVSVFASIVTRPLTLASGKAFVPMSKWSALREVSAHRLELMTAYLPATSSFHGSALNECFVDTAARDLEARGEDPYGPPYVLEPSPVAVIQELILGSDGRDKPAHHPAATFEAKPKRLPTLPEMDESTQKNPPSPGSSYAAAYHLDYPQGSSSEFSSDLEYIDVAIPDEDHDDEEKVSAIAPSPPTVPESLDGDEAPASSLPPVEPSDPRPQRQAPLQASAPTPILRPVDENTNSLASSPTLSEASAMGGSGRYGIGVGPHFAAHLAAVLDSRPAASSTDEGRVGRNSPAPIPSLVRIRALKTADTINSNATSNALSVCKFEQHAATLHPIAAPQPVAFHDHDANSSIPIVAFAGIVPPTSTPNLQEGDVKAPPVINDEKPSAAQLAVSDFLNSLPAPIRNILESQKTSMDPLLPVTSTATTTNVVIVTDGHERHVSTSTAERVGSPAKDATASSQVASSPPSSMPSLEMLDDYFADHRATPAKPDTGDDALLKQKADKQRADNGPPPEYPQEDLRMGDDTSQDADLAADWRQQRPKPTYADTVRYHPIPRFLQQLDQATARRKKYKGPTVRRVLPSFPKRPRSPSSSVSDDSAHPDVAPYDTDLQWALVPYVPPIAESAPLMPLPFQHPGAAYKQPKGPPTRPKPDVHQQASSSRPTGRYVPPQKRADRSPPGKCPDTPIPVVGEFDHLLEPYADRCGTLFDSFQTYPLTADASARAISALRIRRTQVSLYQQIMEATTGPAYTHFLHHIQAFDDSTTARYQDCYFLRPDNEGNCYMFPKKMQDLRRARHFYLHRQHTAERDRRISEINKLLNPMVGEAPEYVVALRRSGRLGWDTGSAPFVLPPPARQAGPCIHYPVA